MSGEIGGKTVRAALALLVRQGATNGLAAIGSILLARWLAPSDFGLFAVATFVMAFAGIFADAGLASSLVRQPDAPTSKEIRAVFSAQQSIILVLVVLVWASAPWLANLYGLAPGQEWFFRILSLTLLLSSFQSIPSLLLERSLDFGALARVEITQSVLYHGTAVLGAWLGWGVWSFACAAVLRVLAGVVLLAWLRPWPVGWHWDWTIAAPRLRFGILLQGSALLNLTKDSIVPMFLGLLAGPAAVGLVGWASTIAAYPILALMPLGRLYFPVFARLQHDRERLGRAMERIITWTNRIAAPITLILLVLARPMTEIVYTPKWLPALELLQMLAFANLLSATSTPCLGLLNGLGLPQKTFRMSVVWLAVTWLVGAPLIWKFGIVGFGIANLCAGAANVYLFAMCKREVPFRILKPIALPWSMAAAAAALSGGLAFWIAPDSLWELLVCGFGGGISYALVMTWLERGSLRKDWELFRSGKTA